MPEERLDVEEVRTVHPDTCIISPKRGFRPTSPANPTRPSRYLIANDEILKTHPHPLYTSNRQSGIWGHHTPRHHALTMARLAPPSTFNHISNHNHHTTRSAIIIITTTTPFQRK